MTHTPLYLRWRKQNFRFFVFLIFCFFDFLFFLFFVFLFFLFFWFFVFLIFCFWFFVFLIFCFFGCFVFLFFWFFDFTSTIARLTSRLATSSWKPVASPCPWKLNLQGPCAVRPRTQKKKPMKHQVKQQYHSQFTPRELLNCGLSNSFVVLLSLESRESKAFHHQHSRQGLSQPSWPGEANP